MVFLGVGMTSHRPDEEHEHVEGCLCGMELADDEITMDSELPEAFGALELMIAADDDMPDSDGCDLDFGTDVTGDQELPVASGGASL